MIISKQEIAKEIFNENNSENAKLLNFIVEICKRNGLGILKEKQKIEYSEKELETLKRIGNFILWIQNNECKNFRTNNESEVLIKNLLKCLREKESLQIFALFCPSYKKGKDIFGFNRNIGKTTKRGLENLSEITKKAESLGFLVNSKAIFSDLALENYNKLNGTAFKDLKENFNQFKEYSKSVNSNILIIPLSKIKDSKERLGIKGILTGKVKLSSNEIKNIVSRSIPFYRDILGWETKEITKRTEDLARSCPIMVEEILKENNNSLMVMTENNYERGRLYYAGLETLPIFYPKKEVKLKIVILGSPLSGKTTIASKLSRILDIPHISAGKLLEKHIEEKGIKVKEEIGKPTFNDNTLIKLIIEKIGQNNNKGFILEGFPRYKEEFKPFEKYIKNIDLLISIKFNHSEALKRFEKRLICLKCNSSFNLDTNIPIKEGECDFCNSRLEKRKDDNLEMVNKRLEEYKKAENSLFSFLKEKANKTIELPADFNIQKINLDMLNKNG